MHYLVLGAPLFQSSVPFMWHRRNSISHMLVQVFERLTVPGIWVVTHVVLAAALFQSSTPFVWRVRFNVAYASADILEADGTAHLVVTHKSILRALLCVALNLPAPSFRAFDIHNAGVCTFR